VQGLFKRNRSALQRLYNGNPYNIYNILKSMSADEIYKFPDGTGLLHAVNIDRI
jgi:hypothetical protein